MKSNDNFQDESSIFLAHKYPPFTPPIKIPKRHYGFFLKDSSILKKHLNCLLYVWLKDGSEHWIFPLSVLSNTLGGYAWINNGWVIVSINLWMIEVYY